MSGVIKGQAQRPQQVQVPIPIVKKLTPEETANLLAQGLPLPVVLDLEAVELSCVDVQVTFQEGPEGVVVLLSLTGVLPPAVLSEAAKVSRLMIGTRNKQYAGEYVSKTLGLNVAPTLRLFLRSGAVDVSGLGVEEDAE